VSKLKAIIDSGRKAGIEAYHGSPYDFPAERELQFDDPRDVPIFDQDISIFDGRAYQPIDAPVPEGARVVQEFPLGRFDSSKIGTGEGAQAYGRGSYLAESEDLARGYRDQLTKPRVQRAQRLLSNSGNDVDLAIENAKKEIDRLKSLDLTPETGSSKRESLISLQEEKIAELTKLKNTGQMSKGSMYKVNIDADPDELIDWDELIDEQPKKVMDKLQSADWWPYAEEGIYDIAGARGENPTGADLVRWLEQDGQEYAAEALEDLGVKGIKYADSFTRHKPKDKRSNNYVIFDPRIIEISKKYGISIPLASAVIAGTVTPEEAQAVGFGSVVKKSLSDKTDEMQQGIGSLPAGDEMVTGGDLQFLMNIGPEGIEKAQRLGGFPMPSLAITRQDLPFQSFGEITLVGSPTKFDPKRLKANVVFNADAYTVRAPQPFRIARKDADVEFREKYQPIAKEFDEGRVDNIVYELGKMEMKKTATAGSFSDVQRFFQSDPVADVAFLRDQGDTRSIPKRASGLIEQSELREMVQEYGDARKKWGKAQLDELFDGQEVFDASVNRDFYTGEGRVFKPYTGEEVVKFMKKSRGAAQEGGAFSVSPGKLRASLTERLTSLKKIRDQSARLVDNEKFTKFKDDSYERVTDLVESLKPFYRFDSSGLRFYDEVIELLIESEKRNLPRVMDEFGFDDVPESVVDEIQGIKSYFRTAPTEYFEAKPQRLVDLEEFEGAIVPEGTSDDLVQALKDAGIQIETYADDAQRLAARKKFGGTAFSVAGGITLVGLVPPEESYAAGPSSFIKMNKVVEDQRIKQAKDAGFDTDTVYYHGSDSDIEEFRMPSRDTGQTKTVGTGVFMSSSPDVASSYAKSIDGAAVYPVYINKKEFLKIRPELEGNSWASISTDGLVVEFPDGSTKPATEVFDLDSASTDTDELSRLARSQGHKGLIIEGIVDTGYGGAGEYRYATKYLQEKGYDVSLPIGSTKEAYDKISAVPSEVMNAARLYAQEKLLSPADVVVSFEPKNIRSINAEFDPEKKDSPQILASAPFAAGITGLGAMAALPSEEAQAGPLSAAGRAAQMGLPVRPAREDLNTVLQANMIGGRVVGDETVPIDSLMGGAASSKRGQDAVNRITEQMSGPDGYIERLIVDQDGNVIEGAHRLDALRRLGIRDVPVTRISDPTAGIDVAAMSQAINDVGVTHPDHVNQIVASVGEMLAEVGGDPAKVLDQYVFPRGYEDKFRAALGALGVAGAAGSAQASEYPSLGGLGVRSRRMPDDVAFKAAPKKKSPGLPSLVGQLGLGAMSEIAGTIFGGAAGVDEYLRHGSTESIRDAREGTSEFVGGLYDAGPEAQQLGQEAVKGIAGIVGPTIDYAMEGPVMDERGLNVLPLIAKALNMSYEGWKEIYDLLPEREQEAVISAADAFL
jgi:hypothetical protein